jgi:hypothetical protein
MESYAKSSLPRQTYWPTQHCIQSIIKNAAGAFATMLLLILFLYLLWALLDIARGLLLYVRENERIALSHVDQAEMLAQAQAYPL